MTKIAAGLIILSFLGGCSFNESTFAIVNNTKNNVRQVSVSDGEKIWNLGNLKPGEAAHFKGELSGEGGASITWKIGSQQFSDTGCYYTSGAPARGSVQIVGNELKFKCD